MSEHQPSSENFNQDQPATPDPFVCEMCGDPLGSGYRFCSRTCYDEWQREPKPKPMTFEEMQSEMEGVLARLRAYPEQEGTS